MKLTLDKKTVQTILKVLLFVTVVIIIVELYPKDKNFKYQYEIGKPWTYELLTSSFDFPIYKTDEQLESDKKELLKNYTPYFKLEDNTVNELYNKWHSDWMLRNSDEPNYKEYVERKLNNIYKKGVVSSSAFDQLQKDGRRKISIVDKDRKIRELDLEDLYTPKTVYEELKLDRPAYVNTQEFDSYNLNLYLVENLHYDSITSQAVKANMISNLSLSSGMVQAGERIIDKGEIVTPGIYSILNSLKIESQKRNSLLKESSYVRIGEVIMVTLLILLLTLYLHLFRPRIFEKLNHLIFISLLIVGVVALTSIALRYVSWAIYIIPFAIIPVIVRVFFDSRTALFIHIITVLIVSLMVDNSYKFLIIEITAGMTAVSGLNDLTSRSQLTQTSLYIFVSYALSYIGLELFAEGDILKLDLHPLLYFGMSSVLLLFAYVLIYIFEKIFGLISSITLVELTNVNSALMLKFAEVAPGTFQHSLQVSNIATEAAKKIGANALLVRTGALYHDIGKIKNPQCFIENQVGGENPLLKLSYEDAAQTIIKHVSDGIAIAKRHRLPEQIIGFISTHHGRSVTKYFYNSFVNNNPGIKPDMEKYTYPGPIPFSKETAILMMADAVEARSRSLPEYTEKSIECMVEDMIDSQIADGQFKDAPISFKDVETVKRVFVEKIINIYHNRITYPKLNQQESHSEPQPEEPQPQANDSSSFNEKA